MEIELISPPAAELGEPTPPPPDELVITTPLDPAPEPREEIPAVTIEEDTPVDETPQPEATVAPPDLESVDDSEPPGALDPDPEVEMPGEDLNVRMAGFRAEYPLYYQNIRYQMRRCFETWRGGGDWRTAISFVINRDGSVSELRIRESSGNTTFDIQVMGAAECAGRPGRLGPLPEDLPFDRFGVAFWIERRTR